MIEAGTISAADLDLMLVTDSVADAMAHIEQHAVAELRAQAPQDAARLARSSARRRSPDRRNGARVRARCVARSAHQAASAVHRDWLSLIRYAAGQAGRRERQPDRRRRPLERVPADRGRAGHGRRERHARRVSRAGDRRLPAGGPGAVARLPRRPAARRSSASRARPPTLATVFVLGLAVAVGGQLFNAAAVVHRGRILGFVPKEKLPTYNVFYEGRTFSRGGPGLALDCRRRAARRLSSSRSTSATVAVEVCEDAWSPDGPMRRRCYSGAEIVVNVSASPYRMGIDATRREMLATRAADNQARAALRQRGRRPGRADLRRRRLRLPERPARPRSAALRRGLVVGGGRSRPHAAAAHGEHDLAHRLRGVPSRASETVPVIAVDGKTADRLGVHVSRPRQAAASSCRPVGAPQVDPRDARARRSVRGARARREELLREDRRVHVARHRALGRPRLDAHAAGRLARAPQLDRDPAAAGAAHRPRSTCRAATRRRRPATAAARAGRRARRRAADQSRSTRPTSARSRRRSRCSAASSRPS